MDAGISALSEPLSHVATLTQLTLQYNKIGDDGACQLAQWMLGECRQLAELDVRCNRIGGVGASALAQQLHSHVHITSLMLGDNLIGDVGGVAVAEVSLL